MAPEPSGELIEARKEIATLRHSMEVAGKEMLDVCEELRVKVKGLEADLAAEKKKGKKGGGKDKKALEEAQKETAALQNQLRQ